MLAALPLPVYENMVALTGIERAKVQFSWVQLGLSVCKYVQLVRRDLAEMCHRALACQRGASAVTAQVGPESRPDAPVIKRELSARLHEICSA